MVEFVLKGGDKPPREMVDFLEENRGDYLRITLEVESSHERLRRSFHALLREWFFCGEWSANGSEIYTYEKLRDYYKLMGCDRKPAKYVYNNDKFDTLELLVESYPNYTSGYIGLEPKSWTKMNKREKSLALNILLTEIRLSMTNNQKVLEWVNKISGDIESLNSINYHKNIGSKEC